MQKNGTRIKTNNDYRLKNEHCNSLIIFTVELSVVRYLILANGMISSAFGLGVWGGGGGGVGGGGGGGGDTRVSFSKSSNSHESEGREDGRR